MYLGMHLLIIEIHRVGYRSCSENAVSELWGSFDGWEPWLGIHEVSSEAPSQPLHSCQAKEPELSY